MLEEFLQTLSLELSTPPLRNLNQGKEWVFTFTHEIEITLTDLQPGISMKAILNPLPSLKKEDLLIYLMRANLLGQGTEKSRIGLDLEEKNLTLAQGLPYEMDYRSFKEKFEEFVNHLIYWKQQIKEKIELQTL